MLLTDQYHVITQMCQKTRIGGIIGVLETIILLNGKCVRQMHGVIVFNEAVDQSIPVVG